MTGSPTFAQVDRHALRLEQAVVLGVGVALRQGLGQGVWQGGLRWCWRRGAGRGGGGGGGVERGGGGGRGKGGGGGGDWVGVDLTVDGRDGAGADRHGGANELPAEAQQAAGHLVDVERRRPGGAAGGGAEGEERGGVSLLGVA